MCTENNLRPFVPKNHSRSESVLWLRGTYNSSHYTTIIEPFTSPSSTVENKTPGGDGEAGIFFELMNLSKLSNPNRKVLFRFSYAVSRLLD